MSQAEVMGLLQQIFDRVFMEPVTITPELCAEQVEEWDSFTQISLIVAVEKQFNIHFQTGEVEATKSIGDFVELILKHQKK